jgi:hypothetical protein
MSLAFFMEAHQLASSYHIICRAQRLNSKPAIFIIRPEKFFISNDAGSRYNVLAAVHNILPFTPENTPFYNAGL